MKLRRLALVLVVLLLTTAASCPKRDHGSADYASDAVATALFTLQDTADLMVKSGQITPADRQKLAQALAPALKVGRTLNTSIASWTPGQPVPQNIAVIAKAVKDAVAVVREALPNDNPAKAQLLLSIEALSEAVVNLLLAIGG